MARRTSDAERREIKRHLNRDARWRDNRLPPEESLDARHVKPRGLSGDRLALGAVGETELSSSETDDGGRAVGRWHVKTGAINSRALSAAPDDRAVIADAIGDGAVTERALAERIVDDRHLKDGAISGRALKDSAVQGNHIAENQVGRRALDLLFLDARYVRQAP